MALKEVILDPNQDEILPQEIASQMFRDDPKSIGLNLFELHLIFDLPYEMITREIGKNRLVAGKFLHGRTRRSVALVDAESLMNWALHPDTPKLIKRHVFRVVGDDFSYLTKAIKFFPIWPDSKPLPAGLAKI